MNLLTKKSKYDITFICRKDRQYFAEPIVSELQKKYNVQKLFFEHKRELSARKIAGSVVWVEWATKFAWAVSKRRWKHKKVIVRLHRFELETPFMKKINWKNVDLIIFVNNQVEQEFKKKINNNVPTITIPNAVSEKDFPYFSPTEKKSGEPTQLISYSLTFHPIKGYLNLIRFFKRLLDQNGAFKLTIMARKPCAEEEEEYLALLKTEIQKQALTPYVELLIRQVPINLKEDRKNVSHILTNYDIFIGFSELESFHYAFAESMLSCLQCFYNGWQNNYLERFWGKWACASEEEMIQAILNWKNLPIEQRKEITARNRAYVIDNFGAKTISKMYEEEFFRKKMNLSE